MDARAVEVVEKIVRPGVYNDLYLSKSENVGMGRLLDLFVAKGD